jgi:hypothetical protein
MTPNALFNYYPLLIVIIAFGVALVLSERALTLLVPDAKSRVMDAFARIRLLNFVGAALFIVLLLWHVRVAWIVVGFEYTALGVYSAWKARRLALPAAVSSRLVGAFLSRSLGMLICAVIYVVRLS